MLCEQALCVRVERTSLKKMEGEWEREEERERIGQTSSETFSLNSAVHVRVSPYERTASMIDWVC